MLDQDKRISVQGNNGICLKSAQCEYPFGWIITFTDFFFIRPIHCRASLNKGSEYSPLESYIVPSEKWLGGLISAVYVTSAMRVLGESSMSVSKLVSLVGFGEPHVPRSAEPWTLTLKTHLEPPIH